VHGAARATPGDKGRPFSCTAFLVKGIQIEIWVADALPWIRKDVDVVRMHRLSFYILIVAIVVLWPGEVAQEPQVGNGLEKEERTLAALLSHELRGGSGILNRALSGISA
jgi:hypothetical protein